MDSTPNLIGGGALGSKTDSSFSWLGMGSGMELDEQYAEMERQLLNESAPAYLHVSCRNLRSITIGSFVVLL